MTFVLELKTNVKTHHAKKLTCAVGYYYLNVMVHVACHKLF